MLQSLQSEFLRPIALLIKAELHTLTPNHTSQDGIVPTPSFVPKQKQDPTRPEDESRKDIKVTPRGESQAGEK